MFLFKHAYNPLTICCRGMVHVRRKAKDEELMEKGREPVVLSDTEVQSFVLSQDMSIDICVFHNIMR